MLKLEHLNKEVGLNMAMFTLSFLLFLAYHVHRAEVWAVQTCWLITERGDTFVDVKKPARNMGGNQYGLAVPPIHSFCLHCWC